MNIEIIDFILLAISWVCWDSGYRLSTNRIIGKCLKLVFYSICWTAFYWSFPHKVFLIFWFQGDEYLHAFAIMSGGITLLPVMASLFYLNYHLRRSY
jgi:hypothetical protein